MPRTKQGVVSLTATPVSRTNPELVKRVLGNPDAFPDEFKAWLPRFLSKNINLQVTPTQLPLPEAVRLVGAPGQPQFQNGWVNYSATAAPCGFWKDKNTLLVYVGGIVKNGTDKATIFTLPSGYRPRFNQIYPVVAQGNGANPAFGAARVDTNGNVYGIAGGNSDFSLDGIIFRQAS